MKAKAAQILLIESFYGGSHKVWADNLKSMFSSDIDILSLPDRFWKWRMEGSAWYFAEAYKKLDSAYPIILFSDLINLSLFQSLSGIDRNNTKLYLYMHENQIVYPWSQDDKDIKKGRDRHYGFMDIMNALAADRIFFNSNFHRESFISNIPKFLHPMPDALPKIDMSALTSKSSVLHIPLDLSQVPNKEKILEGAPIILWNHRWEYDKNPELFFSTLIDLKSEGLRFRLNIIGERFKRYPAIFDKAKEVLADEILHFGYVESRTEYQQILNESHLLPVCSNHDFFGISIVEALAADLIPLLPERLIYPEHLSPELYPECYYSSDDGFKKLLAGLIQDYYPKMKTYRHAVMKYDKNEMESKYRQSLDL